MRQFFLPVVLFVCAGLLFLASFLTLFSAPTSALWIVAILITEWGHYAVLLALALAALSWRHGKIGRVAALLALVAAVLCALPAVRAKIIARNLPTRCTTAFGTTMPASGRQSAFSFVDLFRGVPTDGVLISEHVYAVDGAKPRTLDVYQRDGVDGARPLVMMIHGGSWNGGSKAQLTAINRYLAHEGYTVAAINYRHAPGSPSPAAVEDVFRALAFLKAHAVDLHIDVHRMAFVGRSAGAQIALCAGYSGREPGVRAVVDYYGPADLVLGYDVPSRPWVLDSKKVLADYIGGSPTDNPAGYAAASAIHLVNGNTPPTLLVHGLLDPIVWPKQSEVLAARLRTAGRPHLLLELPWATHGLDANLNGPSGQLSLYALDRLLAAAFASP